MKIEHELNVDQAIESLKNSLGNNNEEKKDNIDYKEFRCRIKSKSGTDINIPGSFIGLCFGIVTTKLVFDIIHNIIKDKK